MRRVGKIVISVLAIGFSVFLVQRACHDEGGSNDPYNPAGVASSTPASTTTRAGADNSEITSTTDANGVRTETRVFKNNPRVARVVVTTDRSGRKTTRVYSPWGSEKVVDNVGDALSETGDAIASGAGWTVDKTKEGATEVGDKLADIKDETAKGTKTVGKKTAAGAKKAGKAIKDAVTP